MMNDKDTEKLEQYKQEISQVFDDSQYQREAQNEDMRFCNVEGGMWEGWLENTHSENAGRARLEFDITSDFVNRFVGEHNLNKGMAEFEAGDEKTSEDDAEFLNGIYRADFSDNGGQLAYSNAVQEVAECGVGALKISTRFEDEGDPENDKQEIIFDPLYNAYNNVYWSTNAKQVDKADATEGTILTTYAPSAYKKEFPNADPVSAFTPTTYNNGIRWQAVDLIYVAERYEVRKEKVKVSIYENLEQGRVETYESKEIDLIKDELKEDGWELVRERTLTKRFIYKSIFNGVEFLEKETRIPGSFIPIIPMYGFRKFIDGIEYSRGLVRKLKDANRLLNANVSRMSESGSSSGDSIPILSRQQVEGLENTWADKTNKSYMVLNDIEDKDGNQVPSGPLGYLQPNQIDPNTIGTTEIVNNFAAKLTGNAPQDTVDLRDSGEALKEQKKTQNLNTQVISENIDISRVHGGKVYLSIAKEIYSYTRSKRSQAEDGSTKIVTIHNMVMDEESGVMMPKHDLTKKKFSVKIQPGKNYSAQRDATIDSAERMMEKVGPESKYFDPLVSIWVDNFQGTGLKPLKEFNRKQMVMSGLVQPETDEEKQMMQNLSQQTDATEELTRAAADQQKAEALNLQAGSRQKDADTKYKMAQAAEKVVDINTKKAKQAIALLTGDIQSL